MVRACCEWSPINWTKWSIELAVAVSALAIDSVDGQRSWPSAVTRLDLLKVVGSSPDFFASPETDNPAPSASRSSAAQIWSWVRERGDLGCRAMGLPAHGLGIITLTAGFSQSGGLRQTLCLK